MWGEPALKLWGSATRSRMTQIHETFSRRLKRLRQQKGTQVEVADALGISRSHLTKMETGGDLPGRETLRAMSIYFGVTMEHLQGGADPIASNSSDDVRHDPDKVRMDAIWRDLSVEERRFILDQLEGLAARRAKERKRANGGR